MHVCCLCADVRPYALVQARLVLWRAKRAHGQGPEGLPPHGGTPALPVERRPGRTILTPTSQSQGPALALSHPPNNFIWQILSLRTLQNASSFHSPFPFNVARICC